MPRKGAYVIARGNQSGVNTGYFGGIVAKRILLYESRKIWVWEGAAALEEIAVYGCNPEKRHLCRFTAKVTLRKINADDVCDIIYCSREGQLMIETQPEWRA